MDDCDNILKFEHPKWKANLVENITVLFQSGELCDLYILCTDHKDMNVTYPCHACILASASPVVRKVLLKNDVFGSWTKMALQSMGISAREWKYILKYVYTGSVSIEEPHIYAVWKAALFLQIDILVTVLATCIHKFHTKEMELNAPVPELRVCPCNISTMGSVFVQNSSESVQNSSGDRDTMIQFFPLKIDRRDKDQPVSRPGNANVMDETIFRKRLTDMKEQESSCRQTGVIDLTQPSPCKSEKPSSPEIAQECSSRKKRKMYTPRKVEAKQKGEETSIHGSLLANVLKSPLKRGYNYENPGIKLLCSYEESSLEKHSGTEGNTSKKTHFRSYNEDKLLHIETHTHDQKHNKTLSGLYDIGRTSSTREMKNTSPFMQGEFGPHLSPKGRKSEDPIHMSQGTTFTSTKPLVIQPLIDEEQPVMNLSLRDRLTAGNVDWNNKWQNTGERHNTVSASHLRDKPLLSNLLRGSSEKRASQNNVERETVEPSDTTNSSVLKTLLVSNDNVYRSPNKNTVQKPHPLPINVPKHDNKRFPQFQDSSDDDIIFTLDVTDNIKADPDYRPKKAKQPRRKSKSMSDKHDKSPASQTNIGLSQVTKPATVEPYSASSILLSMIRDAETKKVGQGQAFDPETPSGASEKDLSGPGKKIILQQPESRNGGGDTRSSLQTGMKGILRNLLNHKNGTASQDTQSVLQATSDIVPLVEETSQTSHSQEMQKPSDKALPFSHVLKNLASAHSLQDVSKSALKQILTSCVPDPSQANSASPQNAVSDKDISAKAKSSHNQKLQGSSKILSDLLSNSKGDKRKCKIVAEVNAAEQQFNIEQINKNLKNPEDSDLQESVDPESALALKVTICKQGQDFKVKEEVQSPECIEELSDSDTSVENSLEIDEAILSTDDVHEKHSENPEDNVIQKNTDIERSTLNQGDCYDPNKSERKRVSLNEVDDSEQLDVGTNHFTQEDSKHVKFEGERNSLSSDNDAKSGEETTSSTPEDSDQEKYDTEHNFETSKSVEEHDKSDTEATEECSVHSHAFPEAVDYDILNQENTEQQNSNDKEIENYLAQSHGFPKVTSPCSSPEATSPEGHSLKIKSYFSMAKQPIEGGYTFVEDGKKADNLDLTRFKRLYGVDCASSVSESCSDTEVA